MHCYIVGLILCSWVRPCLSGCGISEHKGREFVFGVPENGVYYNVQPVVELYMVNLNPTAARTTISTPAYSSWVSPFPINRVIDPYGRGVYKFSQSNLVPSGTDTNNRGVRIVSDIDIIVQVSSTGFYTSDSFLVYPKLYLGNKYMVASYVEKATVVHSSVAESQGPYQFVVTSTTDNSEVRITFQCCTDNSLLVTNYDGTNYYCGDTLTVILDAYFNLQIQSDLDVSGTLVESLHPITVVSGAYWGSVGAAAFVDYMADSALPLDTLGTDYLIPPVQHGDGYALKIIGTVESTSVSITYSDGTIDSFTVEESTGWTTIKSPAVFGEIAAQYPIIAMQLTMSDNGTNLGDASMTILRPTCNTGSAAVISQPYYLQGSDIVLMDNVDIVALVAKDEVTNLRVYGLVENSDIVDSCVDLSIQSSDFLEYSAVTIPWNGDKNVVIRGRLNTNIFVYTAGLMPYEAHSNFAGYVGSIYNALDSETAYCGDPQTTPQVQTTTQHIPTTSEVTTTETTTEREESTLELTTLERQESTLELTTLERQESTLELTTLERQESTLELTTLERQESTPGPTTTEDITTPVTTAMEGSTNTVSTVNEGTSDPGLTEGTSATTAGSTAQTTTKPTTVSETMKQFSTTGQFITNDTNGTTVGLTDKPESMEKGNTTKMYVFQSYEVDDLEEVHEPVESPIAVQLGGSCLVLVLIFIIIIIAIDMPMLYRHTKMFIRNVKSLCKQTNLRKRKLSDQLHLTDLHE